MPRTKELARAGGSEAVGVKKNHFFLVAAT